MSAITSPTTSQYTSGGDVNNKPSYGMSDDRIDRLATRALSALKAGAFLLIASAFTVVHAQSSDCKANWSDYMTAAGEICMAAAALGSCVLFCIYIIK